jgi:hypothetical protein
MILDNEVEVTISNQGKYYASLGYPLTKQGTVLIVKVDHLPKNSNKRLRCSCDECGTEYTRDYQNINKDKSRVNAMLCYDCTRNVVGKTNDQTKAIAKNKERVGSNHPNFNPNKKALSAYAYKVRRITESNYVKNKDLINPTNHARTLCGVEGGYQLDHKVSIETGFRFGINPVVIGSTQNLQMLPWEANRAKW